MPDKCNGHFVQPYWGFPDPTDFRNYGSVQQSGKECCLFSMSSLCTSPITLNKVWQQGTVCHLVCLVMWDCLLLLPFCTNINMILKHANRFLIFPLSLSVWNASGIPKYYWSDPTPNIENIGRAELEIYSCKRVSGDTLLLCWDTWRYPG
jgi:hypothetical protein